MSDRCINIIGYCLFIVFFLSLKIINAASPPNVVMIISDDQYYADFGFMGNEQVQTPHIDALAAKSARFVNGSVPTSVCSPSLATLLTGLYPHEHGIHYNHPPPGNSAFNKMTSADEYTKTRSESFRLIRELDTLPRVLLREKNYRSLQTGKFWEGHYKNAGFTDGMTVFEPVPGQTFGGNRKLANGELVAHGNGDWGLRIGRETMEPIKNFLDDVGESPFFIWYAPYLPHQPHDSPKSFYDLYKDQPKLPKHHLPYYASISQFDETVGELVEMIDSRGLASNTLFVFVIDNGWEASKIPQRGRLAEFAHTKKSKRAPFEPGLRTPILLRWDGKISPKQFEGPVSSIDIVPTILDACGIPGNYEAPEVFRWVSLLSPAMRKHRLDPHRPLFGEIYPGDSTVLGHPEWDIAYRWIKQDGLKLIMPHKRNGKPPWGSYLKKPALYDLNRDPKETMNLFNDVEYKKRRDSLEKQLDEWWNGRTSSTF